VRISVIRGCRPCNPRAGTGMGPCSQYLPIGKDCGVVSLQDVGQQGLCHDCVDVLLPQAAHSIHRAICNAQRTICSAQGLGNGGPHGP
jgi:hypothetical protein